tara:strand:- start:682 stop:924 length:243 start_codon:yes stop_codon:yes gene_type:complete
MQVITMIDNGSNLIPDIIDIESINEVAISSVLLEELLQEYNPEIEENYEGGREVDVRVWALLQDIKMMVESSDVWFLRQY